MAARSLAKAVELQPILVEGNPPPLVSVFVGWAVDPVTSSDPTAFVYSVLDNLPPSAFSLRSRKRQILCEAVIRAAVDANTVDNFPLSCEYLVSAIEKDKALLDNPTLVVELLVDCAA